MAQAAIAAVFEFVVTAAVQYFVGRAQNPTARELRMAARKNRPKVDVAYSGGVQPRRRLYGNFRASGLDVLPSYVTGLTGTRLHRVTAISDGEIEEFTAVNYNNTRMEPADFAGGPITTGPFAGASQIYLHVGTDPQPANSAALAVPNWDTEHRGDGIAYAYHFFDQIVSVFKGGIPVITYEGRGCKIYDPRDDVTPGADPLSTIYKSFSYNPVLQLVDFLLWDAGANEDPVNIEWDDVITAANICDEDVTIPVPVGGGTTTQKRYTSSIEVYSPLTIQERDQTITMLARAFMGICYFSEGKWRIRAGAYTAPVGSIAERDFLDDFTLATAQSRARGGIMNTIRGTYVDEAQATQPKGFPEVSASAYVVEDGEVIWGEVEYPTARTEFEAQRNAIQHLRLSRRRLTITAGFRLKVAKFQLYDVVLVTCSKVGWTSRPCRIIRRRVRQNLVVDLTMMEIDSTDFSDPDPADYLFSSDVSVPLSADYSPNAPRNLRATAMASAILLECDPPLNPPVGVLYQFYEHSSSTPFSSAVPVGPETAQTSLTIPRTTSSLAYFWVRAKDPATQTMSTQSPPTNGVPASPESASASLGGTVTPGSATISVSSSSATTNSVTVTPSGGTAPYTYAWTFTAGGTGITITSASSATTTFSSTGLTEDETRSGTARCRITDNVGATFDVYVAVTITRIFTVTVNPATVAAVAYGGTSAAVSSFVITPDGNITINATNSATVTYAWKASGATAADYDARISLTGGTLQSGNVGVWVQMGGSTAVSAVGVRTPPAGTNTQTLTIEFRDHTSHALLASAAVTLTETVA
jgi:hypothetical protein